MLVFRRVPDLGASLILKPEKRFYEQKHDCNLRLVVCRVVGFFGTKLGCGPIFLVFQFFSDGWFNHHLVNYFDQFSMDVPPQSFDMEPENDAFQVRNLRNSRG